MEEMNEEKAKEILSQKIKIPTVPYDKVFDIEVSGFFLKRCQVLVTVMARDIGETEFKKIIDKLKANEPPDSTTEETIWILLGLVDAMEKAAVKKEIVTEIEVTAEELMSSLEHVHLNLPKQS